MQIHRTARVPALRPAPANHQMDGGRSHYDVPKRVFGVPKVGNYGEMCRLLSFNASSLGPVFHGTLENKGCNGFVRSGMVYIAPNVRSRLNIRVIQVAVPPAAIQLRRTRGA